MKAAYHSVVLFVRDIEKSKRFYNGTMQIDIDMDMGINVIPKNGITLWQINEKHIIPQTVGMNKLTHKGIGFELYFETENMKKIAATIEENGIPMVHKFHEELWGQGTIRIYDPDGNIIEIGETLRCFLTRMK